MAGRPRTWFPLKMPDVRPGYTYNPTSGEIRDPSGNVLARHYTPEVPDRPHVVVRRDDGTPILRPLSWFIAMAEYGAQANECEICGKLIPHRVFHLGRDLEDCRPQNLITHRNADEMLRHRLRCMAALMSERSGVRSDTGEHPHLQPYRAQRR